MEASRADGETKRARGDHDAEPRDRKDHPCEFLPGYLNLKPEQSNTFFKLMEERYTRHSTILTTNLLCGAPHNKFNAETIFMRTPRSMERPRRHFAVFLLRILGAAFNIVSAEIKHPRYCRFCR